MKVAKNAVSELSLEELLSYKKLEMVTEVCQKNLAINGESALLLLVSLCLLHFDFKTTA